MPKSGISFLLLMPLFLTAFGCRAQQWRDDLSLLREKSPQPQFHREARSFMWVSERNALLKYNPLSLGFGGLMYVYQQGLSRHFSAACLYEPSCSSFGRLLIRDHGLVKGVFLTADRVMRCNRLAAIDIPMSSIHKEDHKVHEETGIYR